MHWKKLSAPTGMDWTASLVVFIVAVPLSLGIALASGAPPATGLIAAAIGGIVVGLFSGAPLAVSGPAAGLTVLVYQVIQDFGLTGLAVATALAGSVQLAMGAFRTGWIFSLVPAGVLKGMLAAIGAIILVGQLHVLTGGSVPASPTEALLTLPAAAISALGAAEGPAWMKPALLCGLLAVAIQLLWSRYLGKLKWFPAPLAAVVIVTPLSLLWTMDRIDLAPFGAVMSSNLSNVTSGTWLAESSGILAAALGLALVASAESLLTARAVDILHSEREKREVAPADLNRELLAQGGGNLLSGLLGGLPVTAVIVRSAANVSTGAHTRWSTVLHGVWVAVFTLALARILEFIPLSVLASVLVLTGVRLLNPGGLIQTWRSERMQAVFWVVTLVAIVTTDLLVGLGIGLSVAAGSRGYRWLTERPRTTPRVPAGVPARTESTGAVASEEAGGRQVERPAREMSRMG